MIRQALRQNKGRVQTAQNPTISAPVGGWNAISPLAKMPPTDAVILDNWIPKPGYVESRGGSRDYTVGAGTPAESLLVWRGASTGVDELYAAAGTGIFPITTFGNAWPASVFTITNPRIQTTNFSNDAGEFLINVNGSDTPFSYQGSTWSALSITGSSGPITLTSSDLNAVTMHKSRLYFAEKESLRIWFLATNAIAGAAQLLDLGPVFRLGGTLNSVGAWSTTYGVNQDDYFVAITDQGEVAVFQGDDPADPNYWTQVGLFQIGLPLGARSLIKFGGDLLALTTNGVISLNQAVALDRSKQNTVAVTQKIQNAFQMASQNYFSNFGWDAILYERGSLAIYNIPVVELGIAYQYVQNLQTGSWCRFTGLNGSCWATSNDLVFFGGADGVYQWNVGVTDSGNDLVCSALGAFNYFGSPKQKNFTMVRPTLNATADVLPAIAINTDFNTDPPTSIPTVINTRADTLSIRSSWNSATGLGFCGAVYIQVTLSTEADLQALLSNGDGSTLSDGAGNDIVTDSGEPLGADIQYISADLLFEPGGPL